MRVHHLYIPNQESECSHYYIEYLHSYESHFFSIPSSIMKPTNDEDQSINSSYRLENTVSKRGDVAEKCPICFMIFPKIMSTHNRNIHVNEHYYND